MSGSLKSFSLPWDAPSLKESIVSMSSPEKVLIPLRSSLCTTGELLISEGDVVAAGQPLTRADGINSVAVHASIAGKVKRIFLQKDVQGEDVSFVEIEREGKQEDFKGGSGNQDFLKMSRDEMVQRITDCGVMGARFRPGCVPLGTKIKGTGHEDAHGQKKGMKSGSAIQKLVVTVFDPEPPVTINRALLNGDRERLGKALAALAALAGVGQVHVAYPEDDNEARVILSSISSVRVVPNPVDVSYPNGSVRLIIKQLFNEELPMPGGVPLDCGIMVETLENAFRVLDALEDEKPVTQKLITIAGSCFAKPVNMQVYIGTPLSDIVEYFGGFKKEPNKIILGGPMRGFAQVGLDIGITKEVDAFIALSDKDVIPADIKPCINCGDCINVCPMGLLPNMLYLCCENQHIEDAGQNNLCVCMECGSCGYVCPSDIPILHYIRYGKKALKALEEAENEE